MSVAHLDRFDQPPPLGEAFLLLPVVSISLICELVLDAY